MNTHHSKKRPHYPLEYNIEQFEYADDFVLCNSYNKFTDYEGLYEDLHRRVTWSVDHGLLINVTKCAECLFYP